MRAIIITIVAALLINIVWTCLSSAVTYIITNGL